MKILYFAWLRDHIGVAEEHLDTLPNGVENVETLIQWLIQRGGGYKVAFAKVDEIKVAVNQEFSCHDARLSVGDEVAFFPPVTGG